MGEERFPAQASAGAARSGEHVTMVPGMGSAWTRSLQELGPWKA